MDGTLDLSFGVVGHVVHRTGLSLTRSESIEMDVAGNIFVAGSYRPPNSEINGYLTRLLDDGTPDGLFGVDGELIYSEPGTRVIAKEWSCSLMGRSS